MKSYAFILITLFFLNVINANNHNSDYTYEITHNESGTHYHTPFFLNLTNISNKTIEVNIPNGSVIEPKDESFQNFIITEQLIVQLAPKATKTVPLLAMCIESTDKAPIEDCEYTFNGMANKQLIQLSEFVESKKQYEPDAQFLMWDIAEGFYEEYENLSFEIDEEGIVWVKNEKGERIEQKVEEIDEYRPQVIFNGEFEMNLARIKNIHIAMFNENNVLVKELYKNPTTPIGKTIVEYEFNSLDFEEAVYFVKLVMEGEVIMTREIDLS